MHLKKRRSSRDVNEKIIQQLQIRETIKTHIKKECDLFAKGIKCLSLFFIDEVANYKSYNENGDEVHEYLWKIFEEEYNSIIKNELSLLHPEYQEYLKKYKVKDVHKGYFSIDRKGHAINSVENESSEDNISAYDLILKNKERLLSFDEPTRFIFSHSALREGWDNPNVFQICTLRHANSVIARRQEIGRGLRLCVDENGNRMDIEVLDENIHNVNTLTVIANENYADFVRGFQTEVRNSLRERPLVASIEYFKDKIVVDNNGNDQIITTQTAALINAYLVNNDYVDANNNITSKYREDVANNQLADMGKKLEPIKESIINLIQSIYDDSVLDDMVENGNKIKPINKLNDNFNKEEFQALWKKINHKYVYIVDYTSEELIKNAVASINANLVINKLRYVTNIATQVGLDEFKQEKTQRKEENNVSVSNVRYDLVGEIARGTNLTRRTVVKILSQTKGKLKMFEYNPEAYIKNVIRLIKEQKATMIVEHIGYSLVDQKYESSIFTEEKHKDFTSALKVDKHITDYVFTDGLVENSVEKRFADDLEKAEEVCVYAKLPKAFHIPTPVGNYSPDWAIAFNKGTVKHIFFIAETKGSMDSMQLKNIEKAKIDCAAKLFNEISNEGVKYHHVASYSDLLDCMTQM
ncbi:MAG: hypothetical protein MJZ71_01860 [Bacteroidales bacterium]|nr:hypothetical protein [Bacteroidales bacterium]